MSVPTDVVAIIGAGDSALVRDLVGAGYQHLVAVDLSHAALGRLRTALAGAAATVTFVHADVRLVSLPRAVDVWHDRATLHFLTDPDDRAEYAARAAATVRPGGHLVLAEFAPGGPQHCSGLPVGRDDPSSLAALFDDGFTLLESFQRVHVTPSGADQLFLHALLRRRGDAADQSVP